MDSATPSRETTTQATSSATSPVQTPPSSSRLLEELSFSKIDKNLQRDSVLLWPLGAVEQHGPHLPLNVDYVVAKAVAEAAVQESQENVWLLPTMPITKSNEHAWAAGTLWLSAETMLKVISDVGRCVARTEARKLVFLNAHGGNSALLQVACRELRLDFGLQTFLAHPFVPPDQGGESAQHELAMGIHGGHDETSLMLHLRPDLVDMSKATPNVPEHLAQNQHVRFGGSVSFGWLSNDFGTQGHIGDPTQANPEEGARLFARVTQRLVEQITEIAAFDF